MFVLYKVIRMCHRESLPRRNVKKKKNKNNVNSWKIFHSLRHYLFINTISVSFLVRAAWFLQATCIFIRTYAPYNKHNRQFIDFIGNIAIG